MLQCLEVGLQSGSRNYSGKIVGQMFKLQVKHALSNLVSGALSLLTQRYHKALVCDLDLCLKRIIWVQEKGTFHVN